MKNGDISTIYVDRSTQKQLNLHKPYIDSILLAPQNTQKAKKVLGVHGFRRTDSVVDFFAQTAKNLQEK
jgi:hypothetical protein